MKSTLENCWEIMKCGREPGGVNEREFGVCPVAVLGMGHSCWAVAGTMCNNVPQGTYAEKTATCVGCEVFKRYNRVSGPDGRSVADRFPDEQRRYLDMILSFTHLRRD